MNVSLTPELEKFVDGKVESGLYNNASEVVREGLRLLKEHDELRKKYAAQIERGWQQAQRGEVVDGEKAMVAARERIKAKAKKRA
ncbi:MAG: type II toxin-antitoxin system ParD family antitoxin [Acidobacteria bacterium]|nr:type II toxin-antitoxin system ParD family antitoxin [Acidobacteriota bacterium]